MNLRVCQPESRNLAMGGMDGLGLGLSKLGLERVARKNTRKRWTILSRQISRPPVTCSTNTTKSGAGVYQQKRIRVLIFGSCAEGSIGHL